MNRIFALLITMTFALSPSADAECCFGSAESWVRDGLVFGGMISFVLTPIHGIQSSKIGDEAAMARNPSDVQNLGTARNLEITSTALQGTAAVLGIGLYAYSKIAKIYHRDIVRQMQIAATGSVAFPVASAVLSGVASNYLGQVIGNDAAQKNAVDTLQKVSYIETAFSSVAALAFAIAAGNSLTL